MSVGSVGGRLTPTIAFRRVRRSRFSGVSVVSSTMSSSVIPRLNISWTMFFLYARDSSSVPSNVGSGYENCCKKAEDVVGPLEVLVALPVDKDNGIGVIVTDPSVYCSGEAVNSLTLRFILVLNVNAKNHWVIYLNI